MIHCTGCRVEGAKTPFCDKLCPVHNCVREKGLDTCADCGQMDGCPTLGQHRRKQPVRAGKPEEAPLRSVGTDTMPDTMTVNGAEYTVLRLLGKGKGGYSYLVTDGDRRSTS